MPRCRLQSHRINIGAPIMGIVLTLILIVAVIFAGLVWSPPTPAEG